MSLDDLRACADEARTNMVRVGAHPWSLRPSLTVDELEALLEVVDAARVHLDRLTPTSRAGLIAALARLDGEDTG